MTYEERVNTSAKAYADSYNSYMDFEVERKDVKDFQYEGRREVARQELAIRQVFKYLLGVSDPIERRKIDRYLIKNGYIREKEEE